MTLDPTMQRISAAYERELNRKGAPDAPPAEVTVPATPDVFMGTSARNYAEADDAFWALRQRIEDLGTNYPPQAQLDHLQDLRDRRKAAYADLREWFIACEAWRLGVDVRRVSIAIDATGVAQ